MASVCVLAEYRIDLGLRGAEITCDFGTRGAELRSLVTTQSKQKG